MSVLPEEEARCLAEAQLRQTLSKENAARLERLVQDHPESLRAYVAYLYDSYELHELACLPEERAGLHEWLETNQAADAATCVQREATQAENHAPNADGRPARALPDDVLLVTLAIPWSQRFRHTARQLHWSRHPIRFWAGAAILTTLFWLPLVLWMNGVLFPVPVAENRSAPSNTTASFAARVVSVGDVIWRDADNAVYERQHLRVGRVIELESGCLQIVFLRGTSTILEGPVRFELTSDNGGLLTFGAAAAHVPPAASGFRVDTPLGSVSDLGTEFCVIVDPDGESLQSYVFEGSVEVVLLNGEPQLLTSNQGVVLRASHDLALTGIPADMIRWKRNLESNVRRPRRLAPVRYAMPNGSAGTFAYIDKNYTGQGDPQTPGAPLSGGVGLLTDGFFADMGRRWKPDGWLGWTDDPKIVFEFAEPVALHSVALSTLEFKENQIHTPRRVTLRDEHGYEASIEPPAERNGRHRIRLDQLGLQGRKFTLHLELRGHWVFADEVEFFGAPLPTPGPAPSP